MEDQKAARKRMTKEKKEEHEEWIEENSGIIFKVRWWRIILDEAQYCLTI
jgi:hypothetical protein